MIGVVFVDLGGSDRLLVDCTRQDDPHGASARIAVPAALFEPDVLARTLELGNWTETTLLRAGICVAPCHTPVSFTVFWPPLKTARTSSSPPRAST